MKHSIDLTGAGAFKSPPGSNRVRDAWLLLAISTGLVLIVGTPAQLASWRMGLVLTELVAILLPALVYVRLKRLPMAAALRLKPVKWPMACRAALLGVTSWFVGAALDKLSSPLVESVLGKLDTRLLAQMMPDSPEALAVLLLVGALLPGFCEEVLFRGAIQGTMEKKGVGKGIVITSVLFAAFHMNPWNFVGPLALGLAFGVAVVRTDSVVPAIIWHACVNATAGVKLFSYGLENDPSAWLTAAMTLGFAVAFAEFLVHTAGSEGRASPLALVPELAVSPGVKRILLTSSLACVLLFAGTFTCLGFYRMTTDQMEPQISKGDKVIVAKNRFGLVRFQVGDCIAFREQGKTSFRRVTRLDDEAVWVMDRTESGELAERRVPRPAATGKVIHTLRLGVPASKARASVFPSKP